MESKKDVCCNWQILSVSMRNRALLLLPFLLRISSVNCWCVSCNFLCWLFFSSWRNLKKKSKCYPDIYIFNRSFHNKFGPERFNRFDGYWKQANKQNVYKKLLDHLMLQRLQDLFLISRLYCHKMRFSKPFSCFINFFTLISFHVKPRTTTLYSSLCNDGYN